MPVLHVVETETDQKEMMLNLSNGYTITTLGGDRPGAVPAFGVNVER